MLTFISRTLIRHSNLVKGSLLMVFMWVVVYVLAVGVAVCVGMREHAYTHHVDLLMYGRLMNTTLMNSTLMNTSLKHTEPRVSDQI